MGLLDFPRLIFSKEETHERPIVALALEEDFAQFCVFKVVRDKIDILAMEEVSYSKEEIISALTSLLKRMLAKNPEWSSLEIVFGLPCDGIEKEKIKQFYDDVINQIVACCTFNPLAFVSIPKALAFLLSQNEKTKFNGFLIGIGKQSIAVNLIENGQVKKSERIPLFPEEDSQRLKDSISGFGFHLPPKIVLFGLGDLDKIQDDLSRFSWQQGENGQSVFLHPPKVEKLEDITLPMAVAFATAVDLGFLSPPQEMLSNGAPVAEKEEKGKAEEKDQFGFAYGQDVFESMRAEEAVGQPLKLEEKTSEEPEPKSVFFPLFLVQNFFQFPFWLWQTKKGRFVLMFLAALVLSFVVLFALWWIVPTAKVELFVYSKVLEKNIQVEVDPLLSQTNFEEGKIAGQVVEVTLSDSQKGLTTGKKTVGERARGEVTIFNKTSASRTFAAGTIISTKGLRFTLDSQVTVASRSATIEGITYGKSRVEVTAQEIGEKGNIEAGLDFSIDDFDQSLYSAHNDRAFTGGSQREVNVVSDADKKRLADVLADQLLTKAKQELGSKLAAGWKIEDQAIVQTLISQKFDKEVGEEAQILNLSQEVKFKAIAYKEEDLKAVLEKQLSSSSSLGYEIQTGSEERKIDVTKVSPQGSFILEVKLKAQTIPAFDKDKIARNLLGKRPEAAQNYLYSLPEVASAKVYVRPALPAFLRTMPHLTSRIKIQTTAAASP